MVMLTLFHKSISRNLDTYHGLTHVGQDWGTRTTYDGSLFEMKQTVDAGEYAFSSVATNNAGTWQDYVGIIMMPTVTKMQLQVQIQINLLV